MNLPHEEFACNDLVAIEVPPLTRASFDSDLYRLVTKIQNLGPKVAVIVQPSMRKKTQRSLWVQYWNRSSGRPWTARRLLQAGGLRYDLIHSLHCVVALPQ